MIKIRIKFAVFSNEVIVFLIQFHVFVFLANHFFFLTPPHPLSENCGIKGQQIIVKHIKIYQKIIVSSL